MKGLFSPVSDYSDKKEEFEAQLIEKGAKKIKISDKNRQKK
jgi:hypothetical protein